MTDARWTRIERLFDQAADLSPEEQRALVERECLDDADLRDAVLGLLAHDRLNGERIVSAIEGAARLPLVGEEPGFTVSRCGPYRIVREIGRGGMGVVFEAVRDDGAFTKRVALKVATRAAYSREFLRRFQDERQILARLEHPHIARLLDGGATDDGVPYFAMELVDGVPIHEYVKREQVSLVPRLRLFLQVCDAVDYAHQNLVIHRDLTPRNILVADNSVRLLDFGISKLMDAADGGVTAAGLVPFTPAYCSPEQLHGEAITTRTDVYALGLVLFEILTGTRAQPVDATTPAALERAICETPIPAPSQSLQSRGDRTLARRVRGDLDTIVLAATERDPARRYASVAALADDVRRYLESKPVHARQASVWYRTTRFARRNWGPLTAAALLVIALAAGIVSTRAQAQRADRRFQEVRRIANTLMDDVHAAIRDLPASAKAQEVVVATAVQYLEGLARESGDDRALLTEVGQGYTKVAELAFSLSRQSLGKPDEAARYLDRARAILVPLHAEHPVDANVAIATTAFHMASGRFLFETGERVNALRAMEEAIRVGEDALSRHPSDPALLEALLTAYGDLMATFDTSPAAQRLATRYLERAEQFAQRPSGESSRQALAMAYSQVGKVTAAVSEIDRALGFFRRSAEIQAEIVASEPFNATARRNLMLAWANLADMALGPLGLNSYSGASGPAVDLDPGHRAQALEAATKAVKEAEWLHEHDPTNTGATFDHAIALGRSAPAYPPGAPDAIAVLERSLTILGGLEAAHAARTRPFLIEFYGSLAERHRQTGRFDRAVAAWRDADAVFHRAVAGAPEMYYPRRLLIPIVENWAMALASRGDMAGARALAARVGVLADELGGSAGQYLRAPGWPPRVRAWQAAFYASLGDHAAAERARQESLTMWQSVAARSDLPADLTDEAKDALARSAP